MADRLAAVPLFAGLDPARLRRLAARSVSRTVPAGAVVALHGAPADRLIVVEAGTLTAIPPHRTRCGGDPRPGAARPARGQRW